MKQFIVNNLTEIDNAAENLLQYYNSLPQKSNCIAFYGSMGAGKTTFIKAICKLLGVIDNVTSPTFALMNQYVTSNGQIIYHFDFYRITKLHEAMDIGIEESFLSDNLCMIEWPEIVELILPQDFIQITITATDKEQRIITIK